MSKKIMFNDKYGLTRAVLNGEKTQTRRVINVPDGCEIFSDSVVMYNPHTGLMQKAFKSGDEWLYVTPTYQIDEVVAVAQSYRDIGDEVYLYTESRAGWGNKMFVRAELMPHHIKIVNIRVERLMNISYEDCIKEGILERLKHPYPKNGEWDKLSSDKVYGFTDGSNFSFGNPREAYAALIDKVSGKGTWDSNPYVFVYDFELVD